MIVRTSKSVLFFIPWDTRWIVGTTDTEWSGDRAEPTATAEDVDYILGEANRVLARPLTRGDVLAVYAGLRPLVAETRAGDKEGEPRAGDKAGDKGGDKGGEKPTTKLSREHVVDAPLPGLVSIAGGKFTTYRLMAKDVVDAATADLPGQVPASVTALLPLLGAEGLPAVQASARRIAADYGVPVAAAGHLIARYGSLATEVLDLIRADRALAQPLLDGFPYLRAEVAYAVSHEGALHAEDVLARRVRLLIESPDAGTSAAPAVVSIMAGLLGWSRRRRAAELRRYLDFAAANAAALAEHGAAPEVESAAIPA
jgi:glycerol-3-phosphate dehydrogenase